jgi:hypothetical protein
MTEIKLPVGVYRSGNKRYVTWRFTLVQDGEQIIDFRDCDYEKVIQFAESWWSEHRGRVEYRD